MKARRETFNPFIALSDVTMATVVVLCCIFMSYMWLSNRIFIEDREKITGIKVENAELKKQLADLGDELNTLKEKYRELAILSTDQKRHLAQLEIIKGNMCTVTRALDEINFPWAPSSGPTRLMLRLFDSQLFNDTKLSPIGIKQVRTLGSVLARLLSRQMQQGGREGCVGALVEIQIQGHASQYEDDEVTWRRSVERAFEAQRVLSEIPDFPSDLITIMGAGSRRLAYKASYDAINAYRKSQGWNPNEYPIPSAQLEAARRALQPVWGEKKPAQPDRLDIVLIYAMDQNDDTYVPAHDNNGTLLGPKTDLSHPGFPEAAK